jgi:hypothetical protein
MKSRKKPEQRIAPITVPPLPNHWCLGLSPRKHYVLAQNVDPGVLIIENQGPGKIAVESKYSEPTQLAAGDIRILRVFETISIDCVDELFSSVEFEFHPAPK